MRILHISTRLILGGSQENTILSCEGQARLGHEVHLAYGPIYGPEGSMLERVQAFNKREATSSSPGSNEPEAQARGSSSAAPRPDAAAAPSAASPIHAITTHLIPHMIREVSPLADFRAYRELKRLIRAINPDIVHTHSSKAGILGRAAAWAVHSNKLAPLMADIDWARDPKRPSGDPSIPPASQKTTSQNSGGAGVPPASSSQNNSRASLPFFPPDQLTNPPIGIVHTIHGPPFMPIEGSFTKRAKVRLNNTIYTLAERFAARRCHVIVSVADAMTRQFLDRCIGQPGQYTTVYSGMETDPYLHPPASESRDASRARLNLAPDDFVIGTVARLAEHKGHDDLLDALADDLRAHPDWKLLWVGDGWWRDRLVAKARGLGLGVLELDRATDNASANIPSAAKPNDGLARTSHTTQTPSVVLTGLVPPDRVPAMIRAMDVLAHPSYREGLPRTVPQALLAAVAPIAYDVDGTREVCRDRQTGCLVPLADLAALRAAVRRMYDHPDERREIAQRGRQECAERFSAVRMVQSLETVYDLALRRAGQS